MPTNGLLPGETLFIIIVFMLNVDGNSLDIFSSTI